MTFQSQTQKDIVKSSKEKEKVYFAIAGARLTSSEAKPTSPSSVCHGANQPQFLHLGLVFHGVFLQLQRLSSIYNGFVKTICSFPQCSSSACSQSCWACLSKVFKTERNQVEYYTYNKVALTDTLKTQEWWLAWFFPIFFLSMPMPILFSAKCSIHHSPPFLDLSTCFH